MSDQKTPSQALAQQELALRLKADQLRQEAEIADWEADKLRQRMARIGQSSWYAGSLERMRLARRLLRA